MTRSLYTAGAMDQELQKKITEALNERFVGNYIFTDKEQAEMIEELSRSFKDVCRSWGATLSPSQYELAFVSIVNLTKKWDADEHGWLNFIYRNLLGEQFLKENNTGKAYRIIKDVCENLAKQNKIFYFYSYTKKYYACITSHAMAPKSSFHSFFDLCWKIYCDDLNQEYVKNDATFRLIAQSLKNKLAGKQEDADLKIGSNAYALRASLKGLIADQLEIFISLLDEIICSIDSLFNTGSINTDRYLQTLISEWWQKKEKSFGIEKIREKSSREKIVTEYSQIKAKYIIDNGNVLLFIPAFRFNSDSEFVPEIKIFANETNIIDQEVEVVNSNFLKNTRPLKISLNSLSLSDKIYIRVIIFLNEEVIYDSKESLYRDFILLNDSNEITTFETIPGNYYLYISDIKDLTIYPDDIQRLSSNLFSLNAADGEVLQGKNKAIFFKTEQNFTGLNLYARKINDISFCKDCEEYIVIDGDLFIDMVSDLNAKEYGVRYKETQFRLIDFDSEGFGDRLRFNISSLIDVGEPRKIVVFKYIDNSITASINIVKFNNISISFNRPYYFGDNILGTVRFRSEEFDISSQFNASENDVSFPLMEGKCIIKPPIIKWKVDDGAWKCKSENKPVWYRHYNNGSIIKIIVPQNVPYTLKLGSHKLPRRMSSGSDYDLGRLLYSLKDLESQKELFSLEIKLSDESLILENIFTKEQFVNDAITLNSDEKILYWNPENFIGDENSDFEIRFYQQNNLVKSLKCNSSKKTTEKISLEIGYYDIEVVGFSKGFIKKEIVYLRKKYVLGNEKDIRFRNKSFVLKYAMVFDGEKEREEKVRHPLYITKMKHLKDDIYSGELYTRDHNTGMLRPINSLPDDKGQMISINPLYIEDRKNLSFHIGYGLIEADNEIDYNGEFSLDSSGHVSVSSKTNGAINKSIDYFIMEEVKECLIQ